MPQYLAPGVYIEEVQTGPPPIAGVGTSTAGFVGVTRRGPVAGPATLITSYADFVRAFGGAFDFGPSFAGLQDLPPAIRGFFDNGGQTAFVARVAAATGNTTASAPLPAGLTTRLISDAASGQDQLRLRDLRGVSAATAAPTPGTQVSLQMVKAGITTSEGPFHVTQIDRDTGTVTLSANLANQYQAAYTTVFTDLTATPALNADGVPQPLAAPTDAKPDTFTLQASSPGSWGSAVQIVPAIRSSAQATVQGLVGASPSNQIQLNSSAGFYVDAWVEIDTGATKRYHKVTAIAGPVLTLDGNPLPDTEVTADAGYTGGVRASTCEFDLTVSYVDPIELVTLQENYTGLTLENVSGRYYIDQLAASSLVEVTGAAPADTHPFLFPSAPDGLTIALSGGSEAAPGDLDVLGYDNGPNQRSGLLAIQDVDEVAIIAAPGLTSQTVQQGLIDMCELLLDRFAVLDPVFDSSGNPATLVEIEAQRNLYDSEYAALYYPRLVITNPLATTPPTRTIAPSGHVLGVYARVDQTRGVYKAPANELIQGILQLETVVTKGTQEILNPLNINVNRDFTSMQRGLRIYGARCVTSDSDWNYVNVRRLFIFIETSLDIGTQWAVFEPNDEKLWAQLKDSVSIFLTGVWKDGALMGSKPEEAFFVTVDRTTMTDDDILNGRLIMEIGIAPVRPAEFVVIRIGQWLGGSSVQEL